MIIEENRRKSKKIEENHRNHRKSPKITENHENHRKSPKITENHLQRDQGAKGPRGKGTRGKRDQGAEGKRDQGAKGQRGKGTKTAKEPQRTAKGGPVSKSHKQNKVKNLKFCERRLPKLKKSLYT